MWDLSFSALNEDSGFWPRLQRRCYGGFRRLSGLSQRFWLSRAYFPFLLWVALKDRSHIELFYSFFHPDRYMDGFPSLHAHTKTNAP